jgi:GLPGLI family protein
MKIYFFFSVLMLFSLFFVFKNNEDKHYHVVYTLDYKLNEDQPSYKRESFSLVGNEKASVFESQSYFVADSLLKDGNVKSHLELPQTDFDFSLFKEKNTYTVQAKLGTFAIFQYKEDAKKVWELTKETKNIKGYSCMLARLSYGGRDWDVWYTLDLPIQNGPFKFHGLPGLVVMAEDSTKSYIFSLYGFVLDSKADLNYRMKQEAAATLVSRSRYLQYRKESALSYKREHVIAGEATGLDALTIRKIDKRRSKLINFLELE